MAKKKRLGSGREVATPYKLLVVQERMKGTSQERVAAAFGVSVGAVQKWTAAFRRHGPTALEAKRGRGGKVGLRKLKTPVSEQVIELKQQNETWGTRRIRDVLARFEAIGVSEQQVRRILHEEGLIKTPEPPNEREPQVRRFERATPNQLWQSDIFTFRLRRSERLYVCVFMDDHSRFVVGHALAHHQKSALVMEAFERGIAAYGQPTEVLTDNGRQYTVWRGKTEFEELLARMGVQHIRSRPQHPQTLGKVERFWKTLWDEFLGRTVFAHVFDAQQRLAHFLNHYNFQRPHQALDGLVPADRFFKAAAHVRAEIERAVQANELRLAQEQPPRKPFYVVGQLGDQRLSIAAGATGLQVQLGNTSETIPLKEDEHGTTTARRFVEETPEPTHATLAQKQTGLGQNRAEPRDASAVGPLGREASDIGDRRASDLARLLLPTRDQGDQRDAARARAGVGWRSESGRDGTGATNQATRGESDEGRGSAATRGAPAIRAAETDELWASEDAAWEATEDDNLLDAGWAQKLALLDDTEADESKRDEERIDRSAAESNFDPDAGWRDRGPERWERKLAGESAPSDNVVHEGTTTELYAGARAAERSGPATTLWGDRGRPGTDADRDGRGTIAGPFAQPLPDDLASRGRHDDRRDHAEAGGTSGETATGGRARSGEREAEGRARGDDDSHRSNREDADGRGRVRVWEGATATIAQQEDNDIRGAVAAAEPEERREGDA